MEITRQRYAPRGAPDLPREVDDLVQRAMKVPSLALDPGAAAMLARQPPDVMYEARLLLELGTTLDMGAFDRALEKALAAQEAEWGGGGRLRIFHAGALAQRPRPVAMVKGLLTAGALSILYGAPGSLKSFLAVDLAFAVATGRPWFGRAVRSGGVVYIAAEGGGSFPDRVRAWCQRHDIDLADVPLYVLPAGPDLRDPDGADLTEVLDHIADLPADPAVSLILIDTLSRVLIGGDENSAVDMGALVAALDRLRAETGAHVMAIHHAGKDATRGARGHSSLKAAVDTEILVERDAPTGTATARFVKQRDLQDGVELHFRGDVEVVGVDEDGDPLTSLVVVPVDDAAPRPRRQLTGQKRIARDALATALADAGEAAPASNHIPAGVRVVSIDLWRATFYAMTEAEGDSRRKAFARAVTALNDIDVARTWSDYAWLV